MAIEESLCSGPQPISVLEPGGSTARIAFVAVSLQGRWAPTRAQARPSRIRYLALVRTSGGIEESSVVEIQLASLEVTPAFLGVEGLAVGF